MQGSGILLEPLDLVVAALREAEVAAFVLESGGPAAPLPPPQAARTNATATSKSGQDRECIRVTLLAVDGGDDARPCA